MRREVSFSYNWLKLEPCPYACPFVTSLNLLSCLQHFILNIKVSLIALFRQYDRLLFISRNNLFSSHNFHSFLSSLVLWSNSHNETLKYELKEGLSSHENHK